MNFPGVVAGSSVRAGLDLDKIASRTAMSSICMDLLFGAMIVLCIFNEYSLL